MQPQRVTENLKLRDAMPKLGTTERQTTGLRMANVRLSYWAALGRMSHLDTQTRQRLALGLSFSFSRPSSDGAGWVDARLTSLQC